VRISKADYQFMQDYFKDAKIEKILCFKVDKDRIYDFTVPQQNFIDGHNYFLVTMKNGICGTGNGDIHNHPRWTWQTPSETDYYVWGQQDLKIAGLYRNMFDDTIFYIYNEKMPSEAKL